jgi:2-dehydro-3-deoxyphosphogluconate aldolase/(4S)-4-hydroxy-2-oxoglutarate aldolase
MTVSGAVKVIQEITRNKPDVIVGAGTLFDLDSARRCLDAGASFLTSPGLDHEIVEFARRHQVVVFPGALTPTEIMSAWKAGSDFVKVYPCAPLGGASYVKALKAPLHDVPLIASGGVDQQTAADFILAGAVALGIGRDLVQPAAIARREGGWIRELSRRYVQIVKEARAQMRAR